MAVLMRPKGERVMRTKWDILQERADKLRSDLAAIEANMAWMTEVPFTANGAGKCSACGEELKTEADFAKHFLVPDERFLNLGECPNKPRK
jgi:hypothetical protein